MINKDERTMKGIKKNNKKYSFTVLNLASLVMLQACGGDSSPTPPEPTVIEKSQCLTSSKWSYSAQGAVRSTAVIDDYSAYFSDSAGGLYSVDKITGLLNWQVTLTGALDSKLVLINSMLLVTSDAGQLHAISSVDGSTLWQTELGKMQRSEYDYNISSPVVHDGKAFIAKEDGELIGIDLTSGQVVWQVNLQSPSHSKPVINNGNICVSSMTDLSCIDIESAELLWQQVLDWPSSPATDGSTIVVGSRWDYGVYAFDLLTGQQLWKHDVVDWAPAEPIINNGITYIGTSDNHAFLAIDMEKGERLWRAETVANVFTKAVIADDSIIFSSGYAYNTPGFGVVKSVDFNGETLWSIPGCNFFSSPVVDGASVYIGSDDGYFYALDVLN